MIYPQTARAFLTRLSVLALSTLVPLGMAHATTVSPMVVDLQSAGRGVVANISVDNTSDKPVPIEIALTALDPTNTGLVAGTANTEDLLVMPPSALIPPGQSQSFRVQWIGDPAPASSRHYYVAINQLPVKLPEGQSSVQIVYNIQVLVNVGATGGKPALALQSAAVADKDGKPSPSITVSNGGSTYGYLSQHSLRLTETDAAGKELFSRTISGSEFQQLVGYGLIATGQTRTLVLPIELPSRSGRLSATLLDERGQ